MSKYIWCHLWWWWYDTIYAKNTFWLKQMKTNKVLDWGQCLVHCQKLWLVKIPSESSKKIHVLGFKTYLWPGGRRDKKTSEELEWCLHKVLQTEVQACAKIYHNTFFELQLAVGKIPLIRPQRNDHTQTDLWHFSSVFRRKRLCKKKRIGKRLENAL